MSAPRHRARASARGTLPCRATTPSLARRARAPTRRAPPAKRRQASERARERESDPTPPPKEKTYTVTVVAGARDAKRARRRTPRETAWRGAGREGRGKNTVQGGARRGEIYDGSGAPIRGWRNVMECHMMSCHVMAHRAAGGASLSRGACECARAARRTARTAAAKRTGRRVPSTTASAARPRVDHPDRERRVTLCRAARVSVAGDSGAILLLGAMMAFDRYHATACGVTISPHPGTCRHVCDHDPFRLNPATTANVAH